MSEQSRLQVGSISQVPARTKELRIPTADQRLVDTKSRFGQYLAVATIAVAIRGCWRLGREWCLWWAFNGRIHIDLNIRLTQCPTVNAYIVNDTVKTITTTVKAGPLSNICVYRSIDL